MESRSETCGEETSSWSETCGEETSSWNETCTRRIRHTGVQNISNPYFPLPPPPPPSPSFTTLYILFIPPLSPPPSPPKLTVPGLNKTPTLWRREETGCDGSEAANGCDYKTCRHTDQCHKSSLNSVIITMSQVPTEQRDHNNVTSPH